MSLDTLVGTLAGLTLGPPAHDQHELFASLRECASRLSMVAWSDEFPRRIAGPAEQSTAAALLQVDRLGAELQELGFGPESAYLLFDLARESLPQGSDLSGYLEAYATRLTGYAGPAEPGFGGGFAPHRREDPSVGAALWHSLRRVVVALGVLAIPVPDTYGGLDHTPFSSNAPSPATVHASLVLMSCLQEVVHGNLSAGTGF